MTNNDLYNNKQPVYNYTCRTVT